MSDANRLQDGPLPPVSALGGSTGQLLLHGLIGPPLHPGQIGNLLNYQLISILGEGGMGTVFKALDSRDGRTVAVKILRPELAALPQQVRRFLKEARHMQRLNHPHILPVLEVSNDSQRPYFAMPLMERGSLSGQLTGDHSLAEADCIVIARQVAEALAHAHAKGVIHRDLKPGNVLLDASGNGFLADFGLARTVFNDSLVDAARGDQGEGTVHYMSPQLARGEAEDTRCDIYALGALLYEMLSGRAPYEGPSAAQILQQIRTAPPEPITKLRPDLSSGLAALVEGAMAREHRDRYANMADVLSDLNRVEKGQKPIGPRSSFSFRRMAGSRARALTSTTCFLVIVTGVLLGYRSLTRGYSLELVREFESTVAPNWHNALIGDWDGDGESDIVQVHKNRLQAFSIRGEAHPPRMLAEPHDNDYRLWLLADINNDGLDDAFVFWNWGTNAYTAAFNQFAWPIRTFSFGGTINVHPGWGTNYTFLEPIRLTDLDRDGKRELLAGVVSSWARRPRGIACFDVDTGQRKWFFETANSVTGADVCDLEADGTNEIILASNSPDNYPEHEKLGDGTDDRHVYLYVLSAEGTLRWRREIAGVLTNVRPLDMGPTNQNLFVWVNVAYANYRTMKQPDFGRILKYDAVGNKLAQHDFGVTLTSAMTADLDGDGHREILAADRKGRLDVLDSNLNVKRSTTVVTQAFTHVEMRLCGVTPLTKPGGPHIILASTQRELRGEAALGNTPAEFNNDLDHDNRIIVLDSKLRTVASRLVNDTSASIKAIPFHVGLAAKGRDKTPDILALVQNAQVLRLKRSPMFGSDPSRRETGE